MSPCVRRRWTVSRIRAPAASEAFFTFFSALLQWTIILVEFWRASSPWPSSVSALANFRAVALYMLRWFLKPQNFCPAKFLSRVAPTRKLQTRFFSCRTSNHLREGAFLQGPQSGPPARPIQLSCRFRGGGGAEGGGVCFFFFFFFLLLLLFLGTAFPCFPRLSAISLIDLLQSEAAGMAGMQSGTRDVYTQRNDHVRVCGERK